MALEDLELSLKSLRFQELWTGLWLLALVSIALEQGLRRWRQHTGQTRLAQRQVLGFVAVVVMAVVVGGLWLARLFPDAGPLSWMPVIWPDGRALLLAAQELPWLPMIWETLLLTVLAAGIAIGLPPLVLLLSSCELWRSCLGALWTLLRLIPPPLTVLLLLLSNRPTLAIGALALGLHNAGVMGRCCGRSGSAGRWLRCSAQQRCIGTGELAVRFAQPAQPSHHAYGAYRGDVILRETVVVGLIGGSGLGWQLLESLQLLPLGCGVAAAGQLCPDHTFRRSAQ